MRKANNLVKRVRKAGSAAKARRNRPVGLAKKYA